MHAPASTTPTPAMHVWSFRLAAALVVLAAEATTAKVVSVDVGEDGFVYNPSTIKAAAGDTVEFHIYGQHSVAIWSVVINNTKPIFIYCVVDGHCQGGMVAVINQGADTLAAFKAAAEKTDTSSSPDAPFGGFNGPAPNTTTTSAASGTSGASATSGSKSESATSAASASGTETQSPTSAVSASETQTQSPTSSSPTAATMTAAAAAHANGRGAALGGFAIAVAAMIGL
ncbi:heat shock protein [Purpureocillium lavendulum]|uniref:Heat shock protein n=1 Tax=Purpureocillium lavendulum TaxID=1247861 RepID=A0AB34FWN6_9HYPO|nr:heat shock protein [Purpureocillium lavendulum]